MESWGWYVTLLQIMLLLVLLALPAVADCQWNDLTNDALHYEGNYPATGFKATVKDGEKAPYRCQLGFFPSGLYSGPRVLNATCRGDKWEWDPTYQLSCRPVSCGHPCPNGVCKNGAVTPQVFNFPNVVSFTCNKGYHLVTHDDQYWDPSTTVSCEADGTWSDPAPKCVVIVCPQPTPIADGQVNPTQGTFHENDTIQYTCNQGFTMVGNATRRCQNDARWSGKEPICELQCSAPPPLSHGEIKTNNKWEVGAIIIYACFDGQRQSATCGKDLKWHPDPPTCKDTSKPTSPPSSSTTSTTTTTTTTAPLPPTQCSPLPSPSKGKLFSSDGFRINASVFFSCDEGYALHGPATLVCRPTGAWDPPMMPTCSAPPPWIIILSVCLAVFASLVLCCLGFFYIMRRRRRRTPPPRNYRRQIRKPGPYDAISNDEVARLGKPFPVTSL